MRLALWMLPVATLLPYATVALAKWQPGYDNANPRGWEASQTGLSARALAAHDNHFEAFAPFAAAVLVASWRGAPLMADWLALGFVLLRICYTLAYLTNRPTARSLLWTAGLACVMALFFIGG